MKYFILFFAFISLAGAAGYLQNEDFKTEAELISAGGTKAQLLNDTKIYVTADSINKTLDDAITDGDIGGGEPMTVKGEIFGFNGTDPVAIPAPSENGLYLVSDDTQDSGWNTTDYIIAATSQNSAMTDGVCTSTWTTNTTVTCKYARNADRAIISYHVALTGAPNSTQLTLSPPTGLTFDTSKIAGWNGGNDGTSMFGGHLLDSGGFGRVPIQNILINSETAIVLQSIPISSSSVHSSVGITQSVPFTWGNGDELFLTVSVPIKEWSAPTISALAETQLIQVIVGGNTGQSVTNETTVIFTTVDKNTGGHYDNTTGLFTCPKDSIFEVTAGIAMDEPVTVGERLTVRVKRNTSTMFLGVVEAEANATTFMQKTVATAFKCLQGQTISITADAGGGDNLKTAFGDIRLSIIESPDSIIYNAKFDETSMLYRDNSGQQLTNNVFTLVKYNTEIFDLKSIYNSSTGETTFQKSGRYYVNSCLNQVSGTTSDMSVQIRVNGSTIVENVSPLSITNQSHCVQAIINVNQNDIMTIYARQRSGAHQNMTTSSGRNHLSVFEVK